MVTPCMAPSRGTSPPVWGVLLPLHTSSLGGATLSKFNPPTSNTGGCPLCRLPLSSIPGLWASPPPLPGASTPPPSSTPPRRYHRRIAPSGRTLPPSATPPTILFVGRRLLVAVSCGPYLHRLRAPQLRRRRRSLVCLPVTSALAQHPLSATLGSWGVTPRRLGTRHLPPRPLLLQQRRRRALPPVETPSLALPCQQRRRPRGQPHNNFSTLRTRQSTCHSIPRSSFPPHPLPPGSRNPILARTT